MLQSGQIILFPFPETDLRLGKLRPALVIAPLPNPYGDWLICMISSQSHHYQAGLDVLLSPTEPNFAQTGLKSASLIRVSRLAVVNISLLRGIVGELDTKQLALVRNNLANWVLEAK